MKFAIFFIFATFAFVAQVHAKPTDTVDRGAIADALKTKLSQAKEKLNEYFDQVSDSLKQKIAEAQKQAEEIINELKQKATDISDEVYKAAQKVLEKLGQLEDKIVEQAKNIVNNGKN